jgi:hypothetical protein
MALTSPGVQVSVIDESFYTPAEPGTVPLIVVATAENKQNGAGTGIAPGTLAANAGEVYLITSQKDLVDTFGDPVFKTDTNNNPIHAGEQNEYGLQAAYSLLGVSNRAFVTRANIDLNEITASATEPAAAPANGTYWLDTQTSTWGIFEWNGSAATATGSGQTFTNKVPRVITDTTKVDLLTGGPLGSVGVIGEYAVVATTTILKVFYKNRSGNWVQVGSEGWFLSWPTVAGSKSGGTHQPGDTLIINGTTVSASSTTLASLAQDINDAAITGVTAAVVDNKLELYTNGTAGTEAEDSSASNPLVIAKGNSTLVESTVAASSLGIKASTYYAPRLVISPHTSVPSFKTNDANPRPTGSIWIKTTEPNLGARWRTSRYNSETELFESVAAPIYANNQAALYGLDRTGGGDNLAVGTLYVQYNVTEDDGNDASPRLANFKIFRREATGDTTIRSEAVTASDFTAGVKTFSMAETLINSAVLDTPKTVTFTATASTDDADLMADAINSAGFTNIEAEVDTLNRVVIKHLTGGDFRLADGTGGPLTAVGFSAYIDENNGTVNLYSAPAGDTVYDFVASNWKALSYTADVDPPTALTEDGALWYSSVVDEVDILVHDGDTWVGYQSVTSPYYQVLSADKTDPEGPIVSASEPETQSDGTALKNGDIWIDTSDIDNYPTIYKYNGTTLRWVLVDKSDQTTEDGIVFADARWNTSGVNSNDSGTITELLSSNYLDPDAPDPALYPKGMLLWNLRRSGFNVKKYVRNYITLTDDNVRYNDESMVDYYPHRWVTESANQVDGSGTFGRKAQRKVVIQSLQALVNSNQDIRDDESRVFNLIACPGYPELIGELVTLNVDRGLTAFVVGDSPARLTSDATSLLNWGNNVNLAVEDNDDGLATSDEYLGIFYPWGFTSDNFGNNVVVPPSHMMLRTIALSDQVSYPWFAPAGTRRGGITNASAVGYVDGEGEFVSIALNEGQRDTLYSVNVNPLTFITGSGLVNFGQKTRARNASSLDRINVARLVVYLRRQLNTLAKPYIFEPNDKITRDEIKGAVESLLLELVGQRALYDYLVVCDESNNTPSRIDRNELYVDIAIEPVKAVEFIYIPLRLKNTGEIAGLG